MSTLQNAFPAWAEANYRCIRRISQATTATVWLVRKTSGDSTRLYVLKELHGTVDDGSDDDPTEVVLLTAQQHPFILPVVEMLRPASGKIGMVTEYCDQGDLHSLLIELRRRGERVPEAQVLTWLAQLCLALSHLHKQRILHRDVKTSNIFVTADRTLKLGDFGLARLKREEEAITSRVGSPFYMSPEICLHQPYGSASDLWSLGCVLYEIICLSPAFYAESMVLVLDRICKAQYDPPPEGACSEGVRELLGRLLTLEQGARPSAHDVLEHPALRPVLQQLEPPEPPPDALYQRLDADSDEVAAMRAAVRAAADNAAEEAAEEEEAAKGGGGGGLSLLGLSLLAERGLELLGLAFAPPSPQWHRASTPEPTPSAAELAAEALSEASSSLRAMHAHLEGRLGAVRLSHALGRAVADVPDSKSPDVGDAQRWSQWEAQRLLELGAWLREGAPLSPTPPSPSSTPSPPLQPALIVADGAEPSIARAILALALWRRAEQQAAHQQKIPVHVV